MRLHTGLILAITLVVVMSAGLTRADNTSAIEATGGGVDTDQASATLNAARAGEQINWQVISSGGTSGSSASYGLQGTVAQTAVGAGTSANYGLSHGYWQETPGSGGCCQIRGDVDHSGVLPIDIGDLVWLVDYMFTGGPVPPCWDEGDVDGSGAEPIDIGDLVWLVDYMFTGGPPPPAC